MAKGKQELAERLITIAKENGIRIVDDDALADSLFLFDPGNFIPEYLYEVVAELLAFVYAVDHEKENMRRDNV